MTNPADSHGHATYEEIEPHPLALELLQQINVDESEGARPALPAAELILAEQRIREHLEEPRLFVSLCVIAARFKDRGLERLSQQFLKLAKMGLPQVEAEAVFQDELGLRNSADKLAQRKPEVSTRKAFDTVAASTFGVGFRQPKKMSHRL